MKMKNLVAFAMLALGAVAAPFAAMAGAGDIYEIFPSENGSSLLKPGETLQFTVRLVSKTLVKDGEMVETPLPWGIKHNPLSPNAEAWDVVYNPLKVGIVVSGQLREARIRDVLPHKDADEKPYTDLVCEYTVQPGDIALPVRLALQGSTPNNPIIATPDGENPPVTDYCLINSDYWLLQNNDFDVCEFHYMGTGDPRQSQLRDYFKKLDYLCYDLDLTKSRFMAQGVEFGPAESADAWRTVHKGTCTTMIKPLVETIGSPSNSVMLYVWAKDEKSVRIPKDVSEASNPKYVGRKVTMDMPDGTREDRWVYDIKVTTGVTEYEFDIFGVETNTTTELVLSPVDHYIYNGAGTLCEDFLTVKVACDAAPPPYVTVTLDNAPDATKTPPMGSDYNISVGSVQVKLSEAFSNDVTVALNLSIPAASQKAWTNYVGLSAYPKGGALDFTTNVTFKVDDMRIGRLTQTLYVYAFGSDDDTIGPDPNHGIRFEAKVTKANKADEHYSNNEKNIAATLYLNKTYPVISAPEYDATFTHIPGSSDYTFTLKASDTYKNLTDTNGYDIVFKYLGEEQHVACPTNKYNNNRWHFTVAGDLQENGGVFPVFFPSGDGIVRDAEIWIVAPDGTTKSTYVGGPASAANLRINVQVDQSAMVTPVADAKNVNEGTTVEVKFKLEPEGQVARQKMYAFLIPQGDATNLVTGSETGVVIDGTASGGAEIIGRDSGDEAVYVRLKDGILKSSGGTTYKFKVALCSTEEYDASKLVKGYELSTLTLKAYNVEPTIKEIKRASGGSVKWTNPTAVPTFPIKVPKDVAQVFQISNLSEPGDVDKESLRMEWSLEEYDENGEYVTGFTTNFVGKASDETNKFNYVFQSAGHSEIAVKIWDKDMDPDSIETEYRFLVNVSGQPSITVAEDGLSFNELDMTGKLTVKLSAGAPDKILVKATVEPYETPTDPTDLDTIGRLQLDPTKRYQPDPTKGTVTTNEYLLTFTPGTASAQQDILTFSDLDGTLFSAQKGFRIKLEVDTNKMAQADIKIKNPDGKFYNEFFLCEEARVYVINDKPTVIAPASNGPLADNDKGYIAQIGANEARAITFSVASDAKADVDHGFLVTFICTGGDGTLDGVDYTAPVTITNPYATTSHKFIPNFSSQGAQQITLRIEDKDTNAGTEVFERTWYYDVQAAKTLRLVPHGPTGGFTTSAQSQRYADYAAMGHVWADVANPAMKKFNLSYNCGTAKSVDIYAYGYKMTNAVDNGTLDGGRDVAIDASGNAAAAAPFYTYANADGLDSFFYRWILIQGGGENASVGSISPEHAASTATAQGSVTLPAELGEDGAYDETVVEAVFSYEYLWSDNVGDINGDGIPDVCVTRAWKNSLGGIFDPATGEIAGNDLTKLHGFNDDADYIPAMETSPYGALIPGLKGTWVDLGTPFDAKTEIRGYHEGLNDAFASKTVDGLANPCAVNGVRPDRVYDVGGKYDAKKCTISELEYLAWRDTGLTDVTKWSPERPTDPTMDDTDEDGMPDGYEYYFWYKAHVGYIDVADGKHKYMTGRRYNPAHPCEPDLITSTEIEKAMDPLDPGDKTTVNTRDTDNDGMPDMLEFELGTNPFDYDTDGDGLPDGYEMLIGTDPLDANGYADTKGNPDGDAMAYEYLEDKYEVYGLLTDSGELVYRAIKKLPFGAEFYEPVTAELTDGSSAGPGWRLVTAEGGTTNVFYTTVDMTGKWRTDVNEEGEETYVLCADLAKDVTRTLRKIEDEYYLGLPTYLPRGTVLAVVPLTVDEVKTQHLAMIRDDGSEVGNGDFTLKDGVPPNRFYSAFRYGMTGLDKGEKPVWGRFAVCGDAEIKGSWPVVYVYGEEVKKSPVYLIHHISYQESGFDPRAAWSASQTKSRAFATYDEFLALAFHWHVNARGFVDGLLANSIDGIVPSRVRPWSAIWQELCTDPNNADSDLDGMPDGWELYVMAGPRTTLPKPDDKIPVYAAPHPTSSYGPLNDYGLVGDKDAPDKDKLDFQQEYCGVDSVAAYEGVASIVDVHPEWRNKKWPTDPWNADTDGDGLTDGEEGKAFIYGDPAATGAAGGGLNPLSWDTDGDGLPDPWELEFQGSYTEGASQVEHATTVAADGTTNSTTKVLHEGGSWSGGMDGTVNDANADYDFDGLLNWQEYMVGSMRCWRYDDTFSSWSLQSFDEGEFDALDPVGNPEGYGRYWYERIVCIPAKDNVMGPLPCPPAQGVITENPERGSYEYNPRFVNSIFDAGTAYFSLCTNEWDTAHNGWYMFRDGVYHDLKNPGPEWAIGEGADKVQFNRYSWWVMLRESLPPFPFVYMQSTKQAFIYPKKYICCDPTKADTDNDGMDDYYELFHGMNPLLGKSAGYDNGHKPAVDIVFEAYGGGTTFMADDGSAVGFWSAENNFWLNSVAPQNDSDTGATLVRQPVSKNGAARDFVAYPWLGGLADADPDGDDIRNQEEAIMPNLQASSSWHHTDPTPLWMTDLSYAKSLTYRYYRPVSAVGWLIGVPSPYFTFDWNGDGVIDFKTERFDFRSFPGYDWNEKTGLTIIPYVLHGAWGPVGTIYSFEENEGYDSDHDYLSDFEEAQGKTKPASDPQVSDDPLRRQAMWFDGKTSFLETPLEESEYSPVENLPIPAELPFLYFTAECWARPDDACDLSKPQTVLERAVWNSQSNPGDMNYMRKNFLLGIRNGRWYAKFDSSGTGSQYDSVEITDGPVVEKKWTHLAATYDGTSFKLYMNGVLQVEKLTSITPEHGTWTVTEDEAGALRDGKTTHPYIALLVGASAKTRIGIIFDSLYRGESMLGTMRADYQDFYNGWVDEVRVWDGARTTAQLLDDYRKRYTGVECAANRDEVLAAWLEGANFTDNSPAKRPPELRYHFSFDHLPGAVRAADVIPVPAGFNTEPGVADAKAKHWSRPDDWVSPWWNSVDKSLKSTIYKDFAWTPWIGNTVAHLPRPDGTTVDSMYWSEDYAGSQAAVDLGYKTFGFPRTAEYVSKWTQMSYDRLHQPPITTPTRYELVNALSETDGGAALLLYSFTLRHRTRTGADLLPFGGAFPKRISLNEGGMWDDKGPADAWAETGNDSDNNGLPDWWQAYARANYCKTLKPTDSLDWDTPALYNGILMPAWQAYLRDLARGMLPGGRIDPAYADTRDVDGDNMPDWWEDLIGVQTFSKTDATADPDHDGLSNYQEYLVTERDGLYPLNPRLSHSGPGQEVTDYFLRVPEGKPDAGKYLGEAYADHDFMEDDEEDAMGTDRTKYDAYSDLDEDGWSAFSELRYSTFKMGIASRFLSHMLGASEMKDYPIPVVHATLRYNGAKTLASSNATIVVEAYSGNNLQKAPNAYYSVKPGQTQTRRIFIGPYEDRVVHGTLTPGYVQAGLDQIRLIYAHIQPDDLWSWKVSGKDYKGTYAEMIAAYRLNGTNVTVAAESFGNFDTGIVNTYEGGRQWLQISVDNATQKGHLLLNHERAGDIDLVTGDFSLDLSKIGGLFMNESGVATEQFFYGIEYSSVLPTLQTKALKVSLAEPDVGSLTEGTTAFVAYMDIDGDGYTPGVDPIGFARDVAIGWDQVPELTIEMTDGSQACGAAFGYEDDVDMLRVVRTSINGNGAGVKHRIVFSRNHELATTTARHNVYDGDYLTTGAFGLDWANLASDIALMDGISESDVTQVGYTVVRGKGSIVNIPSDTIVTNFTVAYSAARTASVPYSPSVSSDPIVETQRPTFKWSLPEGYTAFRLQISDAAGKQVYLSDLQKMPPRDASSRYFWTPPVYIGTVVSTNDSWQIANNSNYTWRVAVYNPKFRTTEWSDPAAFTTHLAERNDFSTKYGSAEVGVRYFGPATNELKDVIVQLYRNADFTGAPAAQTRLFDLSDELISLTNGQTVSFHGLESGDYYACAFIDRNGDNARQRYETWGYSANVGRGVAEIWTPVAVTVDAKLAEVKAAEVFLEDTDINQNDIPDCLDDEAILKSADTEIETTTATDTDGDGMPDKWEEDNGLNPYDPSDAENAIDGDVMAYLDLDVCLVHVGKPDGSESAWYALPDYKTEPARLADGLFQPQLAAEKLHFVVTTWKNGNYYGLGTNVTFKAADGLVVLDSKLGTLRLVHAQVYAKKGFNPKTAVPLEDAVDTKPFTALDKYLVGAYFDAIGVHEFKDRHLDPNDMDADGDGIPDGWELYVMYGKTWGEFIRGVTAADSASITPFDRSDAMKTAPAIGSQLLLCEEYDAGFLPTDPWHLDTDKDGVIDYYAYQYHLKGEEAGKDFDGDGLSNYAEYLITEVFKAAQLDPENPKTDGACVDYFRKMGDLYFGEIFTDHDQVDDVWEGAYQDVANRYVYDPNRDDDGDGWSNYAEFRAGTDPSRVANLSIENSEIAEYPQPMIVARITGAENCAGKVIVKVYPTNMVGHASATWEMSTGNDKSTSSTNANSKVLGSWRSGTKQSTLSPSSIQPGSVLISAKDLGFKYFDTEWNDDYYAYYSLTAASDTRWSQGAASDAQWVEVIHDVMREDDNLMGDLVYTGGSEKKTVGWINYETGLMEIDFSAIVDKVLRTEKILQTSASSTQAGNTTSTILAADSYYHNTLTDMCNSYFKVSYVSQFVSQGSDQKFYLTEAKSGHVREGLNTFIAFVDEDGDGEFTPGEPFGVAMDVDVGWQGASFLIGLTRTSAITPRIDLWDDASDRVNKVNEALQASAVNDPLLKVWLTNEEMRVWYAGVLSNRVALVNPPDDGERTRVRVVRYGIDDMFCYRVGVYGEGGGGYEQRAVLDTFFDPDGRDFLCEADFLGDGQFDIDWDYLQSEVLSASGTSQLAISNMTYLVVIGDGPTSFRGSKDTNTTVNALSTMVTRRFEVTRHLPVAENVEGVVYGARPTFCWSIPDEEPWAKAYGTSYTAFKLQILKDDGKTVVYDSGVRRLPSQAKDGSFTWTADAFVGDTTALGQVFGAAGQWKWRVAMYNAKFKPSTGRNEAWSATVSFATAVSTQQETDDHNYFSVDVSVKYTGPALVLSAAGFVRVQAFETADFSGTPAAQISITDINSVKDATDIRKNGTLIGLKSGTYYVRAYIDSNKNGVKDDWESWGQAKEPVVVRPNQLAPITGLYIEDADTDQDWLPDAWEVAKYGNLATKGAEIDPTGKIVLKTEIFEDLANGTANISRFLSGASLTFFQNLGNVSLALGIDGVTEKSIAEIRAMVEKNIDPNSVKITSLTVDPGNGTDGKVVLTVAAKATDSIAGYLIEPLYELPKSTDITINIYRKDNLATDQWTFVKAVPKTITTTLEARVEVPIEGVDFNSGFYKVEIVQ